MDLSTAVFLQPMIWKKNKCNRSNYSGNGCAVTSLEKNLKSFFMISCYELRIGNYVLVNEILEEVLVITGKTAYTREVKENNDQAGTEHNLEHIQSVPLTDDILKQCGFIYQDYFKFWQLITTGIRSEMNINPDYEVIDFMRKPILKKLTSLHQLQNIYFMLKGRELKLA